MTKRSAKVVHFSTVHPANDTRVFHKECRALFEAGYDVTLFARCAGDSEVDGIKVKRVDDYNDRVRRMVLGPLRLLRRLLKERADIYHFHDPELLPIGLILRSFRKRVIYDAHEWVRGDVGSKPYLQPALAKVLGTVASAIEQVGSRVFTHVIAATPFIASQFDANRVTIIHNYPDLNELARGKAIPWCDRETAAAYVGGLNDERCGRELLQAAGKLTASGGKLIVAGPVADGLDPTGKTSVDYLGVIDRQEVADLLGRVRCGVVLLRDLPNTRDAMPTKFFEYLASGLPVVVSKSTRPIAQLTNELRCGVVVDESDHEDIAAAILQLVDPDSAAEEMGRRGQAKVLEELNWATESRRLVHLYDHLLS
jgi:glycosyltransferase involved in cell wall biosynthesis